MAGEVIGTVLDRSFYSPKHFPCVVQEPAQVKNILRMFWRAFWMFWRVQAGRCSYFMLQAHPCPQVCWGPCGCGPIPALAMNMDHLSTCRDKAKATCQWQVWLPLFHALWQYLLPHCPQGLPRSVFSTRSPIFPILMPLSRLGCSWAGAQHGSCHHGDGWVNFAVETRGPKSWLTALLGCECHRRHVHP